MKKIIIISIYIGTLPDSYFFWLESCKQNKNIDWLIISDKLNSIEEKFSNIKVINYTLDDLKKLIEKKLGINIILDKPYKLCDYKPVYGLIFEEYIKRYDFWGHCDMDMIFGNIENFINDDILKRYSKILKNGHLVLYKNNKNINRMFQEKIKNTLYYKTVFNTSINCCFDESMKGIIGIFEALNIKSFYKKIFIDIEPSKYDFLEKDNRNCCYTYEKGNIYKYFINNENLIKNEYLYIHFQKRNINYSEVDFYKNDKYIIDNTIIPFKKEEDIKKYLNNKKNHFLKNIFKYLSFLKKNIIPSFRFKILFLTKGEK